MRKQQTNCTLVTGLIGLLVSIPALAQTTRPATASPAYTLPRGAYMALGSKRLTTLQTIVGMSFSPDGSRLVTAHTGGPVRIWNTESGLLQLTLTPQSPASPTASFVGNDLIAVASNLGSLAIFDVSKGELVRRSSQTGIRYAVGSPDGTRIVAVSDRVQLLDAADLTEVADLGEIEEAMQAVRGRSMMFSADGKVLLTVGNGGVLRLNKSATGEAIDLLPDLPPSPRNLAALSPDGSRIAAGDNGLRVFDVNTGEEIRPRAPSTAPADLGANRMPTYIDFGRGNDLLVAASTYQTRLFDLQTGASILELPVGRNATVSRDGMKLAISTGRSVHVYDTTTLQPLQRDYGHLGPVTALTASPDGQFVVSADAAGVVLRWDLRTGGVRGVVRANMPRTIERLAYSSDGTSFYIQPAGARPILLDGETFQPRPAENPQTARSARAGMSVSPDLTLIAGGTSARVVHVLKLINNEEVTSFPEVEGTGLIDSTAFAPDASALAISDANKKVRIYHLENQTLIRAIDDSRRSGASRIIWSPEGNMLARWDPSSIVVFDLATGNERSRVVAPNIQSAMFSPDGQFLLVVRSGEMLFFDPLTGTRLLRMGSGSNLAVVPAFVTGSRTLAVGDPDGKVPIFDLAELLKTTATNDVASEELIARLRSAGPSEWLAAGVELLSRTEALLAVARTESELDDPSKQVPRLVQQLSSGDQATRERAHLALERLGQEAAPAIRAALANPPAGEAADRLRSLARVIGIEPAAPTGPTATAPDFHRRLILLLEWLGNERAREVLSRFAQTHPAAQRALARVDAQLKAAPQPTTQP